VVPHTLRGLPVRTSLPTTATPPRGDRPGASARPKLALLCFAALLNGVVATRAAAEDAGNADEIVVVTANRIPEPLQEAESSVTALDAAALEASDVQSSAQAADRAPNVGYVDFSARAVSNPQFRGVGGSTTNPGVTTYFDGVPQLSADTSSQELLDIGQIELVRGAQGTLYGRNTLGGVVNIRSIRPDGTWGADGEASIGDFARLDLRTSASTPLFCERCGLRVAYGLSRRDGYTTNLVSGRSLDDRAAQLYRTQALFDLGDGWEARVDVHGEFADDGDFAIGDLAELRRDPDHVRHDFEGHTGRDLNAETVNLRRTGEDVSFESITGVVHHGAAESTDLDATESADLTRRNRRNGVQVTQELRALTAAPFDLGDHWTVTAQGGLFGFAQGNDQQVENSIAPSYLLESAGITLPQPLQDALDSAIAPARDATRSSLDDAGLGVYAQGTLALERRWDATVGLRYDAERKHANIDSVTEVFLGTRELPVVGPAHVDDTRSFAALTPRFILGYAPDAALRFYASAASGYRAGGFNPVAPSGATAYDEEHSWSYELGSKVSLLDERVAANLALFLVDLDDLQLNLPLTGSPGRFYVDNAGQARTKGVELEVFVRPLERLRLDGALGVLDARFGSGSTDAGVNVAGNRLPFADRLTAFVGAQYEYPLWGEWRAGIRGEWVRRGDYFYDAANTERLGAYGLLNAFLWLEDRWLTVRLAARNLTDERVVPLAIPYTTPSGFAGEPSAPRTLGVGVSVRFGA
jgi:iron complex outermembrane receptor protein